MKVIIALIFVVMAIVPVVSAQEENGIPSSRTSGVQAISASIPLVPYANIAIYGPGTASVNQKISIDVSGEVGNIVNGYYQKLYIQKLSSGNCDKVEYVSTQSGFNKVFCTWSTPSIVLAHDTFSSHWEVKLTEPGNYEVVASAVGLTTIPSAQSRLGIVVS